MRTESQAISFLQEIKEEPPTSFLDEIKAEPLEIVSDTSGINSDPLEIKPESM